MIHKYRYCNLPWNFNCYKIRCETRKEFALPRSCGENLIFPLLLLQSIIIFENYKPDTKLAYQRTVLNLFQNTTVRLLAPRQTWRSVELTPFLALIQAILAVFIFQITFFSNISNENCKRHLILNLLLYY